MFQLIFATGVPWCSTWDSKDGSTEDMVIDRVSSCLCLHYAAKSVLEGNTCFTGTSALLVAFTLRCLMVLVVARQEARLLLWCCWWVSFRMSLLYYIYISLSLSYVIYTDAYINITHFPHVFSLSLLLFFLLLHAAKSRLPFSFSKDMICEDSSKSWDDQASYEVHVCIYIYCLNMLYYYIHMIYISYIYIKESIYIYIYIHMCV